MLSHNFHEIPPEGGFRPLGREFWPCDLEAWGRPGVIFFAWGGGRPNSLIVLSANRGSSHQDQNQATLFLISHTRYNQVLASG